MSKPEIISLSHVFGLFDLKGLYIIGYAWLFGMSIWVTFFGGVIAYRSLPRQQFGALQHKTFPIYFMISIALSSSLVGLWVLFKPSVLSNFTNIFATDVIQAYALLSVALMQSANHFVVGPMTSKVMFQRHKQEKEEGKAYTDEGVSDEMKALTRKFGMLHGWSSMLNLDTVIVLIVHGLWIGRYGL